MSWYLEGFSKQDEFIVLNQKLTGTKDAEVARLLSVVKDRDLRIGGYPVEGERLGAFARLAGHEVRDDLDYFVNFKID
ncbi:hypothetical protein PV646_02230 [Streptomyces sp. ID05-26A]|nr:hypothetical protein [Streptomyces sp. ID05-26A]